MITLSISFCSLDSRDEVLDLWKLKVGSFYLYYYFLALFLCTLCWYSLYFLIFLSFSICLCECIIVIIIIWFIMHLWNPNILKNLILVLSLVIFAVLFVFICKFGSSLILLLIVFLASSKYIYIIRLNGWFIASA